MNISPVKYANAIRTHRFLQLSQALCLRPWWVQQASESPGHLTKRQLLSFSNFTSPRTSTIAKWCGIDQNSWLSNLLILASLPPTLTTSESVDELTAWCSVLARLTRSNVHGWAQEFIVARFWRSSRFTRVEELGSVKKAVGLDDGTLWVPPNE